jgi:hypothetical protein
MAIAVTTTKNTLATSYAGAGTWISLHTADPGTTGTSEATGGSPAYARKQTTWGTAASSAVVGSQVSIDVPAGTYTYAGLWSAATAGTFIDKVLITSTTLGAQGIIQVTPTFTES